VVSYRNTGTVAGYSPLNTEGRRWQPGDLVNIARPTSDAGGLATAHVVRVYPTQEFKEKVTGRHMKLIWNVF